MNLDKESAAKTDAPLAPPQWSMEVHQEDNQFTAQVRRGAELMCRVSVMRPDGDEVAARKDLADKARRWIYEYLNRAGGH